MTGVITMVAAMLLLAATPAQAQPPLPSHFSSVYGTGVLHLHLRERGHSRVTVETNTCVGEIEGRARVLSARVVTIRRTSEFVPETCVLRITLSRDYTRAWIRQRSSCNLWHGASCGFDSPTLRRQK